MASARPSASRVPRGRGARKGSAAGLGCARAPNTKRWRPPAPAWRATPARRLYAQRQGVESTLSQGVRAFGLRQARYRGLAKTGLQNVATAAALNLDRLTAWLAHRPLAPTRISRFAALTA